jgi:CheY-like chemotaxis protein
MKTVRDMLVIDDEPVVLQGVERICRSEGLSVDTADGGRAGLAFLEKHAYRLILCDLMMEDLDGFEFLAESGRRGNHTPVIMTTGYSTLENAVRSLQLGAIDYLAKPFTADELMAMFHRGQNYCALPAESLTMPVPASLFPPLHRLGRVSWAALEPVGTVLIGIDDLFVRTMQGIRSVELVLAGTDLVQGSACATMVSAAGFTHRVLGPLSGQVIETHAAVTADPTLIEKDPYGAGWLYRVLPSNLEYSFRCLATGPDAPNQQPEQRKGESS